MEHGELGHNEKLFVILGHDMKCSGKMLAFFLKLPKQVQCHPFVLQNSQGRTLSN